MLHRIYFAFIYLKGKLKAPLFLNNSYNENTNNLKSCFVIITKIMHSADFEHFTGCVDMFIFEYHYF